MEPEMEVEVEATAARESLKESLFKSVDENRDGKLHKEEMRSLADLVGFEGSDERWTFEYEKLCFEHSIDPAEGIPQSTVMELLEDRSESGCYCTTQELREILNEVVPGGNGSASELMPTDDGPSEDTDKAVKRRGGGGEFKNTTVFFAGAGFRTNANVIRGAFEEAGTIEHFFLFRLPDGRSRGQGRVRFSTVEEARYAITLLRKTPVDGRWLSVKPDSEAESRARAESAAAQGEAASSSRQGKQGREKGGDKGTDKGAEKGGDRASGSGGKASGSQGGRGGQSAEGGKQGAGRAGKRAAAADKDAVEAYGWGYEEGWGDEDEDYDWEGDWAEQDPAGNTTVFFRGASFETTAARLRAHFEEAGRVTQFWLFQLKGGRSRGMGVAQYATAREAEHAVQTMHRVVVDGRPLIVKAGHRPHELALAEDGLESSKRSADSGYPDYLGKGSAWGAAGDWEEGWDEAYGGAWEAPWPGGSGPCGGKGGPAGKGWEWGGGSTGSMGSMGKGGKQGGKRTGGEPNCSVFFSGAPFAVSKATLQEYFAQFGPVQDMTLFLLHNGRSRGMGVVTFYTPDVAAWLLAEGIVVEGVSLYLQVAASPREGGMKGKSGKPATGGFATMPEYGNLDRGKGRRMPAYQEHEAYAYYDAGAQRYSGYDEWGYEAGHGSGVGRSAGHGANRADKGGSAPSVPTSHVVEPEKAVFFTNVPASTTETYLRKLFGSVGKVKAFNLFTTKDGRSRGMGTVEYTSEAAANRAYYELHELEVSGRHITVDVCRQG